jgi:broad specificity phosphatase PhoE
MAKPAKIILVRHGESEGNVDHSLYGSIPDHKIELTERGKQQARDVGKKLFEMIGERKGFYLYSAVSAYISPYVRTRQTYECMLDGGFRNNVLDFREDPRLREQEWGNFVSEEQAEIVDRERDEYGSFYYRIPNGESGADVFDRMSTFIETLHRDFKKENYPNNVVIVTHGLTMRLFLMRWLHWSVEEFEASSNPKNCGIMVMEKRHGGYEISEELSDV